MQDRLDLDDAVLLLMDFQNDIVRTDGALGRRGMAELVTGTGRTLESAGRLLSGFRAAGRPVMHVAIAFREGYPDADPAVPLSRLCMDLGCLIEGGWGARFVDELAPLRDEPVVVKRGMSAFAGTDLDLLLRLAPARTLVLAGVATNLVVEATARQGVDLGYRAVVPAGASMGFSPRHHDESLRVMEHFARVTTVDDVLSALLQT